MRYLEDLSPATRPSNRLLILYLGSWSRSGSTLLASVLGEHPGVFDAGELVALPDFFEQGFDGTVCGCGKRHAECELWSRLWPEFQKASAAGRSGTLTAARQRYSRVRPRQLYRIMWAKRQHEQATPAHDYARSIADLYSAIASMTGAQVIVDNSKGMSRALLATRLADANLAVLHVVRHPGAIAFSWRRATINRASFGPLDSSLRWLVSNLGWEYFHRANPQIPYMAVRYEDFAREPRRVVSEIIDYVGVQSEPSPFLSDNEVRLSVNHTVAGNPSRFRTGDVTIAPDDAWRSQISRADRLLALAPALPLLHRYGYMPRWKRGRGGG